MTNDLARSKEPPERMGPSEVRLLLEYFLEGEDTAPKV